MLEQDDDRSELVERRRDAIRRVATAKSVAAFPDGVCAPGSVGGGERPSESRAVVEGEIRRLSVSSIAAFDVAQRGGCNRRWWYKYVARLPEPPTVAASRGGEVHRQIEHWLKTGEDVLGDIARPVKEIVAFEPEPRSYEVERRFADGELVAAGVPLTGYVDYVDWFRDEVRDWKSTGQKLYTLPMGPELIHTIQMPGYGKWFLGRKPIANRVFLSHEYLSTKFPGNSKSAGSWWDRAVIDERWGEIEELVQIRMKPVARIEKGGDVEPNWKACNAFGGCAYRAICPKPSGVAIRALFGSGKETEVGLFENLKAKASSVVAAEKEKLIAAEKAIVTLKGADAEKVLGEKVPKGAALMTSLDRARAAGVLPHDAPTSGETGPKAEVIPAETLKTLSSEIQATHAEVLGALANEEPPAKKRGRPKKSGLESAEAVQGPQIKTITLGRNVNLGNYESARLELTADVPLGGYDATLEMLGEKLAEFVEAMGK